MHTKTRSRKGTLSVENLESRLNLSTLGTTLIPKVQTASLSRTSHSSTFTPTRQSAVRLATTILMKTATKTVAKPATKATVKTSKAAVTPKATTTSSTLLFGDTAISNSGKSTVAVTGYSVMSGAQIEYVNGTPDVGYMSASGADIEYKLNVTSGGTYQLNLGVAAGTRWASYDVMVNGSTQTQNSLNPTGGWQSYTTTTQQITLSAGTNTLRINPTYASQFNINAISLTPTNVSGAPLTTVGSSATVPVASYSAISNSKLESQANGQQDIGYVSTAGAYVEYTLNVQTAGNYNVNVGTAQTSNASFDLAVNGTKSASYSVGSTGSWSNFATTGKTVYLPAGTAVLRFSSTNGTQYNLGSINIAASTGTTATTTTTTTGTTTTVGSSAASVPVASYSAISNSALESPNGSPDIGYVSTSGAYVEYKLNVQSAGNYNVAIGASAVSAAQSNVTVNGTPEANYAINATGSWSNYATVSNSVYLPAGAVTLRLSSAYGSQYNLNGITISPASSTTTTTPTNPVTPTNPTNASGFDATVGTQWMTSFNQLNIVAGSQNDSIYVSQSGSTVTVNVNGVSNTYTGSYGNIVVKAGSGNDVITVDSSVSIDTLMYGGSGSDTLKNQTQGNATIVSIGGGYDSLTGNGKNTAYWADSSDGVNASSSEWSAGDVHSVSSFWGGVSTSLSGQNLTDPAGTGATTRISNASLWGTGPTMSDVTQGQVSDCYYLAALQTMSKTVPGQLRQLAVDLGDGTYAVQFKRGGTTTYVRVDGDLPANGPYANGLEYAHPGSSGDIWMPILEKAYAEFRTSGWNYSTLSEGYFGTVYSDFGVGYSSFGAGGSAFNTIMNALNSGKGVTVGTNNSIGGGAPLIGNHSYTVNAAWTDSSGTQYVQLRNPWGYDGAGNDGNTGDALVTMTIGQLNQNMQIGTVLA